MSRADDLVPLFNPAGGQGDFRQGVVTAWDETTGTNTVVMGGTELTNLPALTVGDFVLLQPGDVVLLAKFSSTYFILGRVLLPSAPDRTRTTIDFAAGSGSSGSTVFGVSTSSAVTSSCTIPVPSWADEAAVIGMSMATLRNTTSTAGFGYCDTYIAWTGDQWSGGETLAPFPAVSDTSLGYGHVTATAQATIDLNANPSTQITVATRNRTDTGTWAPDAVNLSIVSALAVYRRID